ncbi:phosphatase 2C 12 [Gracilariopsis chorda]|uniref:Phosphatase 2C 12 n=1 Tax=Gracilariopsis chorda TaxID=448386 RepID=A0A2V3ITN8_9FLOR|nr:phosphatase 2C 12 [Gracilariopsis chorda]|eukprot:PXF44480.1 phosphatase 2C 12 [Gracilariopsis chorda]
MPPPPMLEKLISAKNARKKSNPPQQQQPAPPVSAPPSRKKASIRRAFGGAANRTFLTSTPKSRLAATASNKTNQSSPVSLLSAAPNDATPSEQELHANDGTERLFHVSTDHAVGACSSAGWQLLQSPHSPSSVMRSRKANQDSYAVIAPFQHSLFVGVYDGHGAFGRAASQLVRDVVPDHLEKALGPASELSTLSAEQRRRRIVGAFSAAFSDAERALKDTSRQIDHAFSGTTATCALLDSEQLYVAWVGDSRAVLATRDSSGLHAVDVSWDQKPCRIDEKKRVRLAGARITRWKKNVGPQRVWLPDEWLPGLAMTRSIGDTILSKYGVVPTPELSVTRVGAQEQFVVLASDGVWEFMSSEEVVQLVDDMRSRSMSAEQAASALVSEAVRRWNIHEQVVDDTTAVVVYIRGSATDRRERGLREVLRTRRRQRVDPAVGIPMGVDADGRLHSFSPSNSSFNSHDDDE